MEALEYSIGTMWWILAISGYHKSPGSKYSAPCKVPSRNTRWHALLSCLFISASKMVCLRYKGSHACDPPFLGYFHNLAKPNIKKQGVSINEKYSWIRYLGSIVVHALYWLNNVHFDQGINEPCWLSSGHLARSQRAGNGRGQLLCPKVSVSLVDHP